MATIYCTLRKSLPYDRTTLYTRRVSAVICRCYRAHGGANCIIIILIWYCGESVRDVRMTAKGYDGTTQNGDERAVQ